MATTPPPKAAAGNVAITGTAVPEAPPRAKVRVAYSPTLADRVIYADGVQGAALRAGVVHLEFYQVVAPGNELQSEQRVISHRVALPLAALNEVAGILANVNQAVKNVQGAAKAAAGNAGEKR